MAMGRANSMVLSKNIFVAALIIALLCMMQMLHVSAFAPVTYTRVPRDVSCNVFGNRNKEASSSKKTASVDTERLRKSGIGGMNTFKSKPVSKKTAPVKKSNVKNAAKNNAPVKKQPTGSVFDVKMSEETPIGTILISFLIPWRNPNSIFLYMLIIVSVLGKMNEQ
jgi:hypothetical protein